MQTPIDVETILKGIKDLPIKEALTYLSVNKIASYSERGFDRVKKLIQDKYNESKYAFVPDKVEARLLKQFFKNPQYKEILLLIPDYRYIDLIRTGLLINHYLQNNNTQNSNRVKEIKGKLLRRPNGKKLLKIVDLPTTPFFSAILECMYHYKSEGYSETQLEEEFDGFVSYWEEYSKLVESSEITKDVVSFCKEQITKNPPYFLILGMKSAATTVEDAIKELMEDNYLSEQGYIYKLTKQQDGVTPRVELLITKERNC